MDFYNRLNYSLGNEDWSVESQALRVAKGDRVICVTASGDRPLHLLMTDCAEIISIDMNPLQSHLLELKMAAIAWLEYEKYLKFLGCEPCKHRLSIYRELKPHLSIEAQTYWDKHPKMLTRGVIYQGMVERLTNVVAHGFKAVKKKDIEKLLAFSDLAEQREFVHQHWDKRWLKKIFAIALDPKWMKLILDDPGLIAHVDSNIKPGEYIYSRMLQYLENNLASKSALLQLVFNGKILPAAYFPYLTYSGHSLIRRNMQRLKYHTANIIETMEQYPANQIDCFSLSDIASYMPQAAFEKLLAAILHTARPNARFCLRKLMSAHAIPAPISNYFKQDHLLEKKLELEESNFVYQFMVGEVVK
jgi:S-adenosylmethionine-diacylglycerol 3-amino-3-carboxypropyl transferase